MLPVPCEASRTLSQDADYRRELFFLIFPKPLTARLPKIFVDTEGNPFMIRLLAGFHLHGLHNRNTRERKKVLFKIKWKILMGRYSFGCSLTKLYSKMQSTSFQLSCGTSYLHLLLFLSPLIQTTVEL